MRVIKTDFIDSLNKLNKAMSEVCDLWDERIDDCDLSVSYPFHQCFFELTEKVGFWVEKCEDIRFPSIFTAEELELKQKIKKRLDEGTLHSFEHKGINIRNPLYDETLRYEVEPIEFYGKMNIIKALSPTI